MAEIMRAGADPRAVALHRRLKADPASTAARCSE
jgi:hypothetical protein